MGAPKERPGGAVVMKQTSGTRSAGFDCDIPGEAYRRGSVSDFRTSCALSTLDIADGRLALLRGQACRGTTHGCAGRGIRTR